ncbi:MAG: EAL domain-containing protein [Gemmatimonadales bacterium]
MKFPEIKFGVVAKLAALLGGLAAASTLLALFVQDRALSADLHSAAQRRLEAAAGAADRVMADHFQGVVERYAAISTTPAFRANLEADHLPTLTFYAERLAEEQRATAVVFVLPSGEIGASAGPVPLAREASQRVERDLMTGAVACVGIGDANGVRQPAQALFSPCAYPDRAEASVLQHKGDLYVRIAVPLLTRGTIVGGLYALEPLSTETLAAWSAIVGGEVYVSALGDLAPANLVETVRTLPDLEFMLSTTYAPEQAAITRSRRNLVLSGLGALVLALIASFFLAKRFTQPILAIHRAAERAQTGLLEPGLDVERDDELGDLGRAFSSIVSRLRGSEWQLGRAKRLARLDDWTLDLSTNLVEGGTEFRRLFGLRTDDPIGVDDLIARVREEDRQKLRTALRRASHPNGSLRLDVRLGLRPGRDRMLHLRGACDGDRISATAQDVTLRWATSRRIKYLSLHDSLTGLGNRDCFLRRLEQMVRDGEPFAVLMVGLTDFHAVASAVGHAAADRVLCEVSQRVVDGLPRVTAPSDGEGEDEVAAMRVGNAEFAMLIPVGSRAEATKHAKATLERLDTLVAVGNEEVVVEASIGICLWPDDAEDVEGLVQNALTALEQTKVVGKDRYQFYHSAMHEEASRRLHMASVLRRAVEHGELEVHYQPRVRPSDGHVVGVEALARWNSDEFGVVPPSEFIPLAEESGLVTQLGEWCLRVAVKDLAQWRGLGAGDLRMAVNVSKHQLTPNILRDVLAATKGTDPSSLEFEVTESVLIEHGSEALGALEDLGKHGFRISLDDFGTGYSSLGYLRQLPIDAVKIDRSFVSELATNDEVASIIWAVVMMCEALNLDAVAEGVETEVQCERVVELGCHEAQGFLFAPPMPAAHFEEFLVKRKMIQAVRA